MCPKTSSHKVPHNRIKILTKDAKQMVNGPYYCPKCKKELLQVFADVYRKEVLVICKCGLEEKLVYAPVFQPIDYYSKFMDIYKKRLYQIRTQPPKNTNTEKTDKADKSNNANKAS
jgi:transcription elongation factor Elf1